MANLDLADALCVAINLLKDSAESRKMPSGIPLDQATADLHADVAEMLEAICADFPEDPLAALKPR